jgi:PHS family inorganic phosphate transporter-like MFS transporter
LSKRRFWINPLPTTSHLTALAQRRIQLTKVLDSYGFNWQVWAVAASGFFTDSYNLFATNVILPALAYVYWPNDSRFDHETAINAVSLAGSLIGQILFGILADLYGRQKLYGVELIVVIVATLGVAQSSAGVAWPDSSHTSMSIFGWLLGWRLAMGCGIGAEYPLSSIITSGESGTTKVEIGHLTIF